MGGAGEISEAPRSSDGVNYHDLYIENLLTQISQTSLTSRVIDDMGEECTRDQVRAALLAYLDTDTVW